MMNHSDKYKDKLGSPKSSYPLVFNGLSKIRIFDEEIKCNDMAEWVQKPRDIQQFQTISEEEVQMLLLEHKHSN
jgi:hypothetical protein